MAKSIFQKLAFATAGAALSLAVIEAHPAHGATITYDFQVDVTSGPLSGNSYDGNFSYDDSFISTFPYGEPTDFNFNFGGRVYTESDLIIDCRSNFPSCLPLSFSGGQLASFQFSTFNRNNPYPGAFTLTSAGPLFIYQLPFNPGEPPSPTGSGTVTYSLRQPSTSVPEPSTVFGLGVLGLGWLARKKIASYQRA